MSGHGRNWQAAASLQNYVALYAAYILQHCKASSGPYGEAKSGMSRATAALQGCLPWRHNVLCAEARHVNLF